MTKTLVKLNLTILSEAIYKFDDILQIFPKQAVITVEGLLKVISDFQAYMIGVNEAVSVYKHVNVPTRKEKLGNRKGSRFKTITSMLIWRRNPLNLRAVEDVGIVIYCMWDFPFKIFQK